MPTPTATTPIDVVDINDRRVGTVARGDALRTGRSFRTAHIFVFNGAGELLLQRLSASRDRHPNRWGSSVAAYLFAGESYEHAAARRMEEELGVSSPLFPIGKVEMRDERSLKFVKLFQANCDQVQVAEPEHIAALKFVDPEVIAQQLQVDPCRFTPTFVHLFQAFRSSFV